MRDAQDVTWSPVSNRAHLVSCMASIRCGPQGAAGGAGSLSLLGSDIVGRIDGEVTLVAVPLPCLVVGAFMNYDTIDDWFVIALTTRGLFRVYPRFLWSLDGQRHLRLPAATGLRAPRRDHV